MKHRFIPLLIFLGLIVFLALGLRLDPREVPSPLIGRPAPDFNLPSLDDPQLILSKNALLGKIYLLNVWASWCVSCREEHPLLVEMSRAGTVDIYGLNYKDQREDARRWLDYFGNPYRAVFFDQTGRTGMDYGVYGVPETYLIDRTGTIRHKYIGPLTQEKVNTHLLPLLEELRN